MTWFSFGSNCSGTKKTFSNISFRDGVNVFIPDYETVVKQQLFHNKDLNMGILSIQPEVSELSKQGKIVRKFLWKIFRKFGDEI